MRTLAGFLLVALASPLAAQSGWRLVPTTDPLTQATDRQLVLRADSVAARATDTAVARHPRIDALVVACGQRLPASAGRSLVLYTTESWQLFGAATGYAELRFDGRPEALPAYLTLVEYGVPSPGGQLAPRHAAFLGAGASPYFSSRLLGRLLAARTLTVSYRGIGTTHTLRFQVGGLREALGRLPACRWSD